MRWIRASRVLLVCSVSLVSGVAFAQPFGSTQANPTYSTQGQGIAASPRVPLVALQALAEREIDGVSRTLQTLASTSEVQSGDFLVMQKPLRALSESGVLANAVWFARPDGSYFTVERGLVSERLSDRPYFAALMAGKPVAGQLVISRSTGKPSIVVAQPVVVRGRVIGAIGVSLSLEELNRTIRDELNLPPGVAFFALDSQGRTVLSSDPARLFEYPSNLGNPSLRAAVSQMRTRSQGMVSYDFRGPRVAYFQRSPSLDWVFAVSYPLPTEE